MHLRADLKYGVRRIVKRVIQRAGDIIKLLPYLLQLEALQ